MSYDHLNDEQKLAVDAPEDVFISACPGSGKTRVLIEKIKRELESLNSTKHRIIAITYTNRAADEIRERLEEHRVNTDQVCCGTIHAFALEWILRPYSCYDDFLKTGFIVADEKHCRQLLDNLKKKYEIDAHENINTSIGRDGKFVEQSKRKKRLLTEYCNALHDVKLIDFNAILYLAYKILNRYDRIGVTLGSIISLLCIDEYQDTYDLQYGILSEIKKGSNGNTNLFVVGDPDQAIYASLGGVARNAEYIINEFDLPSIRELPLTVNFRSTQRIVDFYSEIIPKQERILSQSSYAGEWGQITFQNQNISREQLPETISTLVSNSINKGIPEREICILAPRWYLLTDFSRQLVIRLPNINFEAPGLSPFANSRENIWYGLAKICLSTPHPDMYWARLKWASNFTKALEVSIGRELFTSYRKSRDLLKLANYIRPNCVNAIEFLTISFTGIFNSLGLNLADFPVLQSAMTSFLENAQSRIDRLHLSNNVTDLARLFNHSEGALISTCHSIKGDEFDVVICFGLLDGMIPAWQQVFDPTCNHITEAEKLLYVISSRAKRHLHLISETDRKTQRGRAYITSPPLSRLTFEFDRA